MVEMIGTLKLVNKILLCVQFDLFELKAKRLKKAFFKRTLNLLRGDRFCDKSAVKVVL